MAIADSGSNGATDNELSDLLQAPGGQNNIRPRRGELVDAGYVADSGQKRRTGSGSQATVWRLSSAVRTSLTPSFTVEDCNLASYIAEAADGGQPLDQPDRASAQKLRARFALLGRRARRKAGDLGIPLEISGRADGPIALTLWPSDGDPARLHLQIQLSAKGLHLLVQIGSAETGDPTSDNRAQRFRAEMLNLPDEVISPAAALLAQGWTATISSPDGDTTSSVSFRDWLRALVENPRSTGVLSEEIDADIMAKAGDDISDAVNELVGTIFPIDRAAEAAMKDPVQALVDGLFWDEDRARRLLDLARRSRQLIFAGPPGTGKTLAARILSGALGDESRIKLVQFHPTYAYEDFVEGIRPVLSTGKPEPTSEDQDANSALRYSIRPGVFKQLVANACSAPLEALHFLIIDEINRANLPRVLGELLFALEYRGPENEVELAYSAEKFYVPENLWVIGTMNTADRSVAVLDAAMRRRFKEVRFDVDYKVIRRWHERHTSADLGLEAADRLKRLNEEVVELLDDDRAIGHSFLIRKDLATVGFESIWHEDLEPVLRDHLLGRTEDLPSLRKAFLETL